MTHAEIIQTLGGYKAVAKDFGLHPTATFRWTKGEIPLHWWAEVERLARSQGNYEITQQMILENRPKRAE